MRHSPLPGRQEARSLAEARRLLSRPPVPLVPALLQALAHASKYIMQAKLIAARIDQAVSLHPGILLVRQRQPWSQALSMYSGGAGVQALLRAPAGGAHAHAA